MSDGKVGLNPFLSLLVTVSDLTQGGCKYTELGVMEFYIGINLYSRYFPINSNSLPTGD